MAQTHDAAELNALIAVLSENASKPAEEARALPPGVYHSPEFLALEESEIFSRQWICIGRADSIPETGDYIACDILDQPVVAIRGKDGVVRGLSNVCLHRMARLLEGKGNAKRLVCPYHAWTYGLDGALTGAPHMEQNTCFNKKDYKLRFEAKRLSLFYHYEKAATAYSDVPVIAINGASREVKAFALFSYHPQRFVEAPYRWIEWQRKKFGNGFSVHGTKSTNDMPFVDHWWPGTSGSGGSMWGARKLAWLMGFDPVILCGCPLVPGNYAGHKLGMLMAHQDVIDRYRHEIQQDEDWHEGVISMSGWTQEFFCSR